jgi:hypothetical protein
MTYQDNSRQPRITPSVRQLHDASSVLMPYSSGLRPAAGSIFVTLRQIETMHGMVHLSHLELIKTYCVNGKHMRRLHHPNLKPLRIQITIPGRKVQEAHL